MRQIANMHIDRAKDTKPTFRLTDLLAPVGCIPDTAARTHPGRFAEGRNRIRHRVSLCVQLPMVVFDVSPEDSCHRCGSGSSR